MKLKKSQKILFSVLGLLAVGVAAWLYASRNNGKNDDNTSETPNAGSLGIDIDFVLPTWESGVTLPCQVPPCPVVGTT